jgi:hypothetical protein
MDFHPLYIVLYDHPRGWSSSFLEKINTFDCDARLEISGERRFEARHEQIKSRCVNGCAYSDDAHSVLNRYCSRFGEAFAWLINPRPATGGLAIDDVGYFFAFWAFHFLYSSGNGF